MIKVITYGTYDFLHYGHIRLLERAKALGDYLVVGVTADDFDRDRGKINVRQSLMERIEAVKATGIADEIIVEEYEGQKIDDIKRLGIDIFTVGSDWVGKFDYLNEFCKVVYLERTKGISSTDIRSEQADVRLGLIGQASFLNKVERESMFVNGLKLVGICTQNHDNLSKEVLSLPLVTDNIETLVSNVDALYIISSPIFHFEQIKKALLKGKHILCESPLCLSESEWKTLKELAVKHNCVLMDAIRTAYSTAFSRMLLLIKSGKIGQVVSIDATCTSLRNADVNSDVLKTAWNSICTWGPAAMLPVFSVLGAKYKQKIITSHVIANHYDTFTKISFIYPHAVASIKVGNGMKSESELIISGTKGYIYVPAPWWKTDYFEIRYENPADSRRYFYQLEGEGIRYELVSFIRAITSGKGYDKVGDEISLAIVKTIENFYKGEDLVGI